MSQWVEHIDKVLQKSKNAVYEIETGIQLEFNEIFQDSFKYSHLLKGHHQEIVSVLLPNSIEYIKAFIGIVRSGNIFNPIPYFIEGGELKKVLSYLDPVFVISDRSDISKSVSHNDILVGPKSVIPAPSFSSRPTEDSDIACLYYSSGTTGSPKGVMYSHKNIYALIDSICKDFKFSETTRQFAFLPFGHTASINYNINPSLFLGSPLYISMGFEHLRSKFFRCLSKYEINYTQLVPSVLLMLNKLKCDVSNLNLDSLEFIGCGSSTLPEKSQIEFQERYGLKVGNLYGLSETGPSHLDDPRVDGWQVGSIGRPLSVNECKISDSGEILLKGDNVFAGYYKNEELTSRVIEDGWFHTGDLGESRGDTYFFSDRKKDLIIKSGINIVPAEIEEAIYKSNLVQECVVVGKKNDVHGEEILAAIVLLDKNLSINEAKHLIVESCREHLSSYKIPKYYHFIDSLPKTHSGKFLRKDIRERYAQ